MFVRQSAVGSSIRISFPGDIFSKRRWVFFKLGMYIDIMEIWPGIANRQFIFF